MTTTQDLNAELIRLSRKLDEAHAELVKQARAYADAEHAYRLARSSAFLSSSGTVGEREAHTDQATAGVRRDRDLAEGLKQSALEAVRSLRGQMSATQTIAGSLKAEMELARTGPN